MPFCITTTWLASARTTLQIVADEHVGEVAPLLQVAQQLDDLRLHGHVEGRGRLVEHDELRLERHGAGDGDALALAAGEFVRVAVHRRRIEADIGERLRDDLAALRIGRGPRFCTSSPSSTISATDMRGESEP